MLPKSFCFFVTCYLGFGLLRACPEKKFSAYS
jgi:hypothetical protein